MLVSWKDFRDGSYELSDFGGLLLFLLWICDCLIRFICTGELHLSLVFDLVKKLVMQFVLKIEPLKKLALSMEQIVHIW